MSDFTVPDIQQDDTRAGMQALGYIDSSPDEAARAMELEKATGTPAAVIDGDLEGFERQHKAQLAGGIVKGNPHIADYVNSHPMAAKISSDDYGNLDQASQNLDNLKPRSVLGAAAEGFKAGSGYGEEGVPTIGSWLVQDEKSMQYAIDHPLTFSIASAVLATPEAIVRGLSGAAKALGAAGGEVAAQVLNDPRARQWGEQFADFAMDMGRMASRPHLTPKAREWNRYMHDAAASVKPYLDAGVEPPVGTHEVLDSIKGAQNEIDIKALNEAMKASQQSLTRERNPDLYANFIRLKTGDQSIGISADAVRKLYGDKAPMPDDGLLGFVPDLEAKLAAAEAVGGHVEVPLADWLARVEPDVAKGLEEDIRVRPEGVTKRESEVISKAAFDVYHGSPYEFEAFKDEAIGSGEGAQAYGHGHYVAQNPGVAESYAKPILRDDTSPTGIKINESKSVYRVRVKRNPEEFLDWDKPLSEQPSAFQDAIVKKWALMRGIDENQAREAVSDIPTTGDIYKTLERYSSAKQVSKDLHEAGILGIKYLDQGSRFTRDEEVLNKQQAAIEREKSRAQDAGRTDLVAEHEKMLKNIEEERKKLEGGRTHNFVVFDPSDLEILDRNGQAVSAIRKAAMLDRRLPEPPPERGIEVTSADGSTIRMVPTKEMSKIERQVEKDARQILNRILGKDQIDIAASDRITFSGTKSDVQGLSVSQHGVMPLIAYLVADPKALKTVRHEAIHQLMNWGLITDKEWAAVKEAALTKNAEGKDWLDKHNIRQRYKRQKDLNEDALVEEAFAEEFGEWGNLKGKADQQVKAYKGLVEGAFEKVQDFFKQLYDKITEYFGHPPDVKDLFEQIESGKVRKREIPESIAREDTKAAEKDKRKGIWRNKDNDLPVDILDETPAKGPDGKLYQKVMFDGKESYVPLDELIEETKKAEPKAVKEPELPSTRRMEDRDPFGPGVIGHQQRYLALIQKQLKEDFDATAKRAMEDQKRKLTAEWKTNYAEMRNEVADDLLQRPDIAADRYFLDGLYGGRKVEAVKIGTEYVPEEVRAGLSKNYFRKDGSSPDDIAPMFGFPSGQALVEALTRFNEAKRSSGMRPFEYVRRLIDTETERRMEAKYGKLGDRILEEAKEQVLSETQVDLLHEETLKLATDAGYEFTMTKEQMKAGVKDLFGKEKASDISSDKFIADAGRAGRAMEEALLKGDAAEAFRQKQRQYLATLFSREALGLEKDKKAFEKLSERLTRKDIKNIDKDFVNWAQDILVRSGVNIKRSFPELQDSLERSGFASLDEFVKSKQGDGWELTIAPEITDPRFGDKYRATANRYLDGASVEEFQNLKDAIEQMDYVGKEVQKIEIGGAKMLFEDFKHEVLRNIGELPVRNKNSLNKWLYRFDAELTRMEEVFKDLDLRKAAGPLFSALIRPMIDAKHTEYSMQETLSKRLMEIKGANKEWQKTLKDTVAQDFFFDPWDNTPFDLTREHMINIMLNFGNESNIEKFTKGYAGDRAGWLETKLLRMIHDNATKEDWEFVQNMWDVFGDWKKQSSELYYKMSGRQPQWIEPQPIQTPHGQVKGGYWPVIYDRNRAHMMGLEIGPSTNSQFGPNYFRATPTNNYTKTRTGFSAPIEFQTSIESAASRMQQMIHDISFREAVMSARKVISDRDISQAIKKHYGPEYEAQLKPWLDDIANHFNQDEVKIGASMALMRKARMNLVGHALGFNLKVIGSPAIAMANPADLYRIYSNYSESSKLAYEKSREIPHTFRNIDRDFRERLEQTIASGGLSKFQADAIRWSFTPTVKIEQQFRIITFVNEYQKALREGLSDGDAAAHADSLVRERHGSSGIPDMPAIMRGNEFSKLATMFYGYFSAMYNWQRQMPQQARAGEFKKLTATMWGSVVIPAAFGALMFNNSKEGDSWWKHIAKAIVLQPLQTIVFVRDLASWFIEGNPARTPLATLAAAAQSGITDSMNAYAHKKVKKPIQHAGNVIGLATGLPLAQVSRTAQFVSDINNGQQRPRNIAEWARGFITGEARLKK